MDRMIFNFLIGNADAHGKNSSILYRNGKAGLAPIYDVMSTVVYSNLSKVNAMSIGGAKRMADVTRCLWPYRGCHRLARCPGSEIVMLVRRK